MFLRIRGKGASPENSQAALLHLRGFRHTHTRPIKATYRVTPSTGTGDNNKTDEDRRDFIYSHFPIGIQSAETLDAQRLFLVKQREKKRVGDADEGSAAPSAPLVDSSAAVLHMISDDAQRMVWKETWNAYDIVYDEVLLMPPDFAATNAMLKTLHQAEQSALPTAELLASPALMLPTDYVAPRRTTGNRLVLVATHYYRSEVIPLDVWENSCSENNSATTALPEQAGLDEAPASTPPVVVVIDLTGVDPALVHQKIALELAWSVAYATTQMDNPLLRATAIVVRLPYEEVPSSVTWLNAHASSPACAAVLQMYDFIGQHIALVYKGLWLSCPALQPLSSTSVGGPPVHFIGSKTRIEDDAVLQALVKPKKAMETDATTVHSDAAPPQAVVLGCDSNPDLSASAAKMADAWGVPVALLVAPVQALVDGGDEPWDPYTQRERERLNFCPCCGDCDHTHESSSHGHGHGHGH